MNKKYFKLFGSLLIMFIGIMILSACDQPSSQLTGDTDINYNADVTITNLAGEEDISAFSIAVNGDSVVTFTSDNYDTANNELNKVISNLTVESELNLIIDNNEISSGIYEIIGDTVKTIDMENPSAIFEVSYTADTAFFEVTITNVPAEIDGDGQTVNVDYTVKNTGNLDGTENIVFNVNGYKKDGITDLTLASGETDSGTFSYTTVGNDIDEGQISVEVTSDNDTDSATVLVNRPHFAGGSGTELDPYQIENWYHLDKVREYGVEGGKNYSYGTYFRLNNDIDHNSDGYNELASMEANEDLGWNPLGDGTNEFTGHFDGMNHIIKNIYISRGAEDHVGLFSTTHIDASITRLGLVNVNILGKQVVGGLVGWNKGTIIHSSTTGNIKGDINIGGLVGSNSNFIYQSYSSATVEGAGIENDNYYRIGGLVGVNNGTISNSYATGNVSGSSKVGGLLGENKFKVEYSYAVGQVNAYQYANLAGGLIGYVAGTEAITIFSYYDTNTTGQTDNEGKGTPKTTVEMKQKVTYENWSFIFDNPLNPSSWIWEILEGITYPYLPNNRQNPLPE